MKVVFLCLNLSRGTIFTADIGQAVFGGRRDARGHVGARLCPPSLIAARYEVHELCCDRIGSRKSIARSRNIPNLSRTCRKISALVRAKIAHITSVAQKCSIPVLRCNDRNINPRPRSGMGSITQSAALELNALPLCLVILDYKLHSFEQGKRLAKKAGADLRLTFFFLGRPN